MVIPANMATPSAHPRSARPVWDDPPIGPADGGGNDPAAEALRRSEARLDLYLSQVPVVMWTTDLALRFTDTRGAGLGALGSGEGDATGCTLAERLGEQAGAVAAAEHHRALAGEVRRFHLTVGAATFDATVQPLRDDAGRIVGVTGVALDISAQARLQEQLYLAQKLEAVGRLAGGVAHDFNNLLSVIQGNTDLLLMDTAENDPTHDELSEIRRACERAGSLTQQLLAFSRRQLLHPRVVDLNAQLRETERMLRRLIGEDIVLHTRFEGGPALVRVDPGQIEQVILNLAVNARDAMPRGGELSISTRRVLISDAEAEAFPYAVTPGEYVELVVRDSGVGMDETVRRHAFEPFFTTKTKGTGLGLSTAYGIVKQSGGYVWVESAPGEGARFRVCLPRVEDAAPEPRSERVTEPLARGGGTVLVVEDEEAVRAVARRILERAGYTVLEAGDGAAALAICRSHSAAIDLVLTDVVMPGLSGRELADQLLPLLPRLRVLYMTGYSDERLASYGVAGERPDLIGKPFRPGALLEKVRAALAS